MERYMPELRGVLRSKIIEVPKVIRKCTGIKVFGKRIKSIVFTTDVAIIENIDADAIIAVYPFTPQPTITSAITMIADVPVFAGVGGGLTMGKRVVNLALDAEFKGAVAVVVNAPTSNETIKDIRETIDIPIVVTVVSEHTDIGGRLDAGANVVNVSGANKTVDIVKNIRKNFPKIPIIATGGPTDESILATIEAGANAITYTPPASADLFKISMDKYRTEQ